MLGFVRQFMPYRGLPIGVDLGEHTLRLAQVEKMENEYRLVHAVEASLGTNSPSDRSAAIATTLRSVMRTGSFQGRKVALAISGSSVQVKHIRLPRCSGDEFVSALREHATRSLNIDPSQYLLRSVVAGDVFGEQTPQQEVVLFATPLATIQELLDASASARVEVVGVHVQPRITAELFSNLYRRKADEDAVNLFVDLGANGTRAFVAAPFQLQFVRAMSKSIVDIHTAVARKMNLSLEETATLRRTLIAQQTTHSNDIAASAPALSAAQQKVQEETASVCAAFAEELEMCRRYYEATFPSKPVTRLIFVGGGARDRLVCSAIAQAMSLPAQVGDPLIRFNRNSLPTLPCIDRREPMPQWSVAFGLSLCGQTVAHV